MSQPSNLHMNLGEAIRSGWAKGPTASDGVTLDLQGKSDVFFVLGAGTYTLPNAAQGTRVHVIATGAVDLRTVSSSTVVLGLASGQTGTVTALSSSTWGTSMGILDAGAYTSATTVETALQRLMRDTQAVHVNLHAALDADGDPLAKFADGASAVPGFNLANTEAFGIRWNDNGTHNTILLSCSIPRSFDANTSTLTMHVVASKTGTTDTPTFLVAAYSNVVGLAHDAGADLGGTTSAMVAGTAKLVQRVTLSMTNANAPLGSNTASPTKITFTIKPTNGVMTADDVIIHDIYFTWDSVR